MNTQSNDQYLGGGWGIPVPPADEHFLREALFELRIACASTANCLVPSGDRARFEDDEIGPAYRRVQREVAWLLKRWGISLALPIFRRAKETAAQVRVVCDQMARGFDAHCTLQAAARAACVLWMLRHVGVELLAQVWADESFSWEGNLGPQCYSDSTEFADAIWDLAAGRETADQCLVKPLALLLRDEGIVVRDPGWAALALRGDFEESYLGQLPLLPLAAWATCSGWPHRLWDRVEGAGEGRGPWIIASERNIAAGCLGGDDEDPFGEL